MTAISNSTNGLLVTAPEPVRERYRGLKGGARMNRLAECRPAGGLVEHSALVALKSAAKAWKALKRQSGLLEERMRAILEEHARPLLDMYCVGTVIAAALAIVAGDNPERIRSEAAFAQTLRRVPAARIQRQDQQAQAQQGRQPGRATWRCTASPSSACDTTNPPGTTPPGRPARAKASSRSSAASNGSSPARRTGAHRHTQRRERTRDLGRTRRQAARTAHEPWHHPTAGRRGAMRAVQPHQRNRTR